jgi:3-dehydrosphinganine reductase
MDQIFTSGGKNMTTRKDFLKDKVVLVTGGSSGIGLATAVLFAQQGATLWLLARDPQKLASAWEKVQAAGNGRGGILSADVTQPEQVDQAVKHVIQESSRLDILISNAGITYPGYVQDIPLEIYRELMDVNYFGCVHMVKAVLPEMMARRSGYIVIISSAAGFINGFGYAAYGATKFALSGFSQALMAEMKPQGICVSVVYPCDTDTPQLAYENEFKPPETRALAAIAKVIQPEEVAEAIMQGMLRRRYRILVGTETKLVYLVNSLAGGIFQKYLDGIVRRVQLANKKS